MDLVTIAIIITALIAAVVIGVAVFAIVSDKKDVDSEGTVDTSGGAGVAQRTEQQTAAYPPVEVCPPVEECPIVECPIVEGCPIFEECPTVVCPTVVCPDASAIGVTSVSGTDIDQHLSDIQYHLDKNELQAAVKIVFDNGIDQSRISSWDVSTITNFSYAFTDTDFNQPLDEWVISKGTNFRGMFKNCKMFNQNLNKWFNGVNTPSGNFDFTEMFKDCDNFNDDLLWTGLNGRKIITDSMFENCVNMVYSPAAWWGNVKFSKSDMMHKGCKRLEFFRATAKQFEECDSANQMFQNCIGLERISFKGIQFPRISTSMFRFCPNLKSLDENAVTTYNTSSTAINFSRIVDGSMMFDNCTELKLPNNNSYKFSNLKKANKMFNACEKLEFKELGKDSGVVFPILESAVEMFNLCTNLNPNDVTNWGFIKLSFANKMFFRCSRFGPLGMNKLKVDEAPGTLKTNLNQIFVGTRIGKSIEQARNTQLGSGPWATLAKSMAKFDVYDMFAERANLAIDKGWEEETTPVDEWDRDFTYWRDPLVPDENGEPVVRWRMSSGDYDIVRDGELFLSSFQFWGNNVIPWAVGSIQPPGSGGTTVAQDSVSQFGGPGPR